MSNVIKENNIIAFAPGFYLQKYLTNQEISQEEFAKRIGISKSKMSKIINGNITLDDETINKIAIVLGTSKELWRNLDNQYKDQLFKIKEAKTNEQEKPIVKELDYNFWVKLNILPYARNWKEKINNLYWNSHYITYCDVYNYTDLKKAYDKTLEELQLAVKYDSKETICDEKKLILEGLIDSISEDMKSKIADDFNSKIAKLDNEMIRTIEVFFECGLNLSESAKALYIHRNTLIYRLDKIQKVTSYDIREFNNAMIFKIIFLYIGRKKSNLTVEKV